MSLDLNQIYSLLPLVYRTRDAEFAQQAGGMLDAGEMAELQNLLSMSDPLSAKQEARLKELQDKRERGPLKALVAILAEQIEVLQESLYQAYDDQFIETCQEWVVPYIGDLVGARRLSVFPGATFSPRALVADTLAYRRRKGTVSVLERLARDATNWGANVVEYFQVLATTEYMNHIRSGNLSMVSVRGADVKQLNTPFDAYARTADVRNIASGRGKYNIPNVGIFLWRIPDNPMKNAPAFRLDGRRYFFDAIGRDTPLFTYSEPEDQITQRATRLNVPMPISRRIMNANLADYYGVGPNGETKSILLRVDGQDVLPGAGVPPKVFNISVCDLSDVKDSGGNVIAWAHQPQNAIGIDPELGRIAFPSLKTPPRQVEVSYFYGFSAEIGGGQYSRPISSGADVFVKLPGDAATIQDALDSAVSQLTGIKISAVIEVQDNSVYDLSAGSVIVPQGTSIELRAADQKRPVLNLSGDFEITGGNNSAFRIDGLLIVGDAIVTPAVGFGAAANAVAELQLSHATLAPSWMPRLRVAAADVSVSVDKCILGSIRATDQTKVTISNSIVDALDRTEVAYAGLDDVSAGGPLTIRNTTVIGKVHALRIDLVSNTILAAAPAPSDIDSAPVRADQLQQGCVRFSYIPLGSRVPRAYRCHPSENDRTVVYPQFTSMRFGDPGYCQLAPQSGAEITEGADDQSEMGVFHDLSQLRRESNLRANLQEYLRFALEAGIFDAS